MTITGAHGRLEAAGSGGPKPWMIPVSNFQYTMAQHTSNSGGHSGAEQTVTIEKEPDAFSPQLFQMVVSNELLKSVVIDFSGAGQNFYTFTIEDAQIASVRRERQRSQGPNKETELIKLAYAKITVSGHSSKNLSDSWTQ